MMQRRSNSNGGDVGGSQRLAFRNVKNVLASTPTSTATSSFESLKLTPTVGHHHLDRPIFKTPTKTPSRPFLPEREDEGQLKTTPTRSAKGPSFEWDFDDDPDATPSEQRPVQQKQKKAEKPAVVRIDFEPEPEEEEDQEEEDFNLEDFAPNEFMCTYLPPKENLEDYLLHDATSGTYELEEDFPTCAENSYNIFGDLEGEEFDWLKMKLASYRSRSSGGST